MKKVLITSILILAIISSLLAGTVSYYTTTIDVAAGSVTAKEFIFASEHKENSFTKNTKIAPGESVKWSFQVMNHENGIITETDLYYKLTFTLNAADGKNAIVPVKANIRGSEDGSILATATHGQPASITDEFLVAVASQAKDYFVEIVWPHGDNDSDYAGSSYGSAITVSAIASQLPFESETQPVEPEEPVEPGEPGEGEGDPGPPNENGVVEVTHRIKTAIYGTPADTFDFQIVLTNIGHEVIDSNWAFNFSLPTNRIVHLWDDNYQLEDLGNGKYRVQTNNPWYVIKPNSSRILEFQVKTSTGEAESIADVAFNGIPVEMVFKPLNSAG